MQNIWRYLSIKQQKRGFKCKLRHVATLLKTFQLFPIPYNEIPNPYNGPWDLEWGELCLYIQGMMPLPPLLRVCSSLPGLSVLTVFKALFPSHCIYTCLSPAWVLELTFFTRLLSSFKMITGNTKCSLLNDNISKTIANIDPSLVLSYFISLLSVKFAIISFDSVFCLSFLPDGKLFRTETMTACQSLIPVLSQYLTPCDGH